MLKNIKLDVKKFSEMPGQQKDEDLGSFEGKEKDAGREYDQNIGERPVNLSFLQKMDLFKQPVAHLTVNGKRS